MTWDNMGKKGTQCGSGRFHEESEGVSHNTYGGYPAPRRKYLSASGRASAMHYLREVMPFWKNGVISND
jgi:hypothetical protein